jgi:hypothetical protein
VVLCLRQESEEQNVECTVCHRDGGGHSTYSYGDEEIGCTTVGAGWISGTGGRKAKCGKSLEWF